MAFLPISAKPLAWVDTETTGLDADHNDILEIFIARVELDGQEKVFHSRVQMARPENAHPKALEINGYTPEKWEGASSSLEVFSKIHELGLLQDCILAGHNVGFDAAFINATYKRLGIHSRVDYHLFDTVTLALEHLKPYIKSVSLVHVCVALGIPVDNAHTAQADCRMAMAVHHRLTTASAEERASWAQVIPARLTAWEASTPKG